MTERIRIAALAAAVALGVALIARRR